MKISFSIMICLLKHQMKNSKNMLNERKLSGILKFQNDPVAHSLTLKCSS